MENKTPLTFGSIISIRISSNPNLYLFSQGFFVNEVFIYDFSLGEKGSKTPDFFLTTFKILPFSKLSHFKSQKIIKETLIDHYNDFQILSKILAQFIIFFWILDFKKRKETIINLKQDLDEEFIFNINVHEKLKGTPLVYSTSIFQLMHMASCKFLQLNVENENNIL